MRLIDYHMHTHFSADSEALAREHVEKAVAMGLDEICFTDHEDFRYPDPNYQFDLDVPAYRAEIAALQADYADIIPIKWGIEMGLDRNYSSDINAMVAGNPFDFVIGSIHVIRDTEFYDPAVFFDGKTKEQAHCEFFDETLACVEAFDCFDVLGHLDYIVRYGPYEDKSVDYERFNPVINEILRSLIAKGKGIEVNSSGFREHGTCGFPNWDVVKRYHDFGGRILTIGTDSHDSGRVGEHVATVAATLAEIGFDDVTCFSGRHVA